jgi:hypothetical protein
MRSVGFATSQMVIPNINYFLYFYSKDIKDKVSKIRIGYNIVNITELYAGKSMQEIRVYLNQNLFLV